ncbi:hypothetical protein [Thiohalophilus sp.]|uniref:hypothetical protein n=1 Tax=Thiohalophilus sp. TaxID=3028392 RepID=UPI003974980F
MIDGVNSSNAAAMARPEASSKPETNNKPVVEKPDTAELSQAGKEALAKFKASQPEKTATDAAINLPGSDPVAVAEKATKGASNPDAALKSAGIGSSGSRVDLKV